MDIRCKWCGEPWDIDGLHDVADDADITFDDARRAFYIHGCGVFECFSVDEMRRCPRAGSVDRGRLEIIDMLQEISGDDVDGLASDLADAEWMGVL